MHTYRDARFLERRLAGVGGLLWAAAIVMFLVVNVMFHVARERLTVGVATEGVVWMCGGALALAALFRRYFERWCGEIRLSDDGWCEFETKRGMIVIHATEIISVTYSYDDDSDDEGYTIYYQGGKVEISDGMADFVDFLARLTALNPAVDLSTFPPKWSLALPYQDPSRRPSRSRYSSPSQ